MAFVKKIARSTFAGGLSMDAAKVCTFNLYFSSAFKGGKLHFTSGDPTIRRGTVDKNGWTQVGGNREEVGDCRTTGGNREEVADGRTTGGNREEVADGRRNSGERDGRIVSYAVVAIVSGVIGGGLYWMLNKQKKSNGTNLLKSLSFKKNTGKVFAAEDIEPGKIKAGLPTYTQAEVAAHKSMETRIWVTYGNGVYDVTDYVEMHPGGKKILMAAGKSVEPFWSIYSAHKNNEIYETLESFRIGNITEVTESKEKLDENNPYKNDPERPPILIQSSAKPFNAEPPQELLVDQFITPVNLFFIRNHLPVPCVTLNDYSLDLQLPGSNVSLTFEDLKTKFKKSSVTAITQCAGNRRSEMVKIKPVKGLNWGIAAIGNAKWSGVALEELLKHHGVDIETVRGKYIIFEGLDKQEDGTPYGASIPLELARILKNDIIIAYEMNNCDIPRDHGYPVRVIVPGVVGARQVKWLKKIYFSCEESTSHWQRNDYKGFNSSIDWHNVKFDNSVSISQLPVTSAICDPPEGTVVEEGADEITMKGYAWSGGGRGIIRVDVSADGGKTWHEARLKPNGQTQYKSYSWTLWEADVPLPKGVSETTLICKAVDISYNVQPDSVEGIWNLRGCLSNAWHRVNIKMSQVFSV